MNTRRHFLGQSLAAAAGTFGLTAFGQQLRPEGENIQFGLCTYLWGADWDVPTLITNLKTLGIRGIELRVEHAHKVSPTLTPDERSKIRDLFVDSEIEVIGMGTNAQFDALDKGDLMTNLDLAQQYIKLSHDIGGGGVKVKPNNLHEKAGISKEKTLEQIGQSLARLGDYALGFGQEIRLEVHGDVSNLLDIRTVMEVAKTDNVRVCWNSNRTDIVDGHINKSFELVKVFLGQTLHIHEQDDDKYPYDDLAELLVNADYSGWVLLEAEKRIADPLEAIRKHKEIWENRLLKARRRA